MAVTGVAASTGCLGVSESAPTEQSKVEMTKNPIIEEVPLPIAGPWPTLDPFLFCVHHNDQYPIANGKLGPKASLARRRLGQDFSGLDGWSMYHGESIPGFPRHPHRGFETVTAVKKGLIDHADSLGAGARYGDGDVQWLTAGDGINHAEMFPLLETKKNNPMDFYQIWLNLPAKNKRVPPRFSMHWANQVPQIKHRDKEGRSTEIVLVAGRLNDLTAAPPPPDSWAADPNNHVGIWRITMVANATWTLPAGIFGLNRALYTVKGSSVRVNGKAVKSRLRLTLRSDTAVQIENGATPTELLVLQGKPIDEPVVQHGPFVMNTRREISQAISDYRRTQFGGWPWPASDPVHGTDPQRFARQADGRMERPT